MAWGMFHVERPRKRNKRRNEMKNHYQVQVQLSNETWVDILPLDQRFSEDQVGAECFSAREFGWFLKPVRLIETRPNKFAQVIRVWP